MDLFWVQGTNHPWDCSQRPNKLLPRVTHSSQTSPKIQVFPTFTMKLCGNRNAIRVSPRFASVIATIVSPMIWNNESWTAGGYSHRLWVFTLVSLSIGRSLSCMEIHPLSRCTVYAYTFTRRSSCQWLEWGGNIVMMSGQRHAFQRGRFIEYLSHGWVWPPHRMIFSFIRDVKNHWQWSCGRFKWYQKSLERNPEHTQNMWESEMTIDHWSEFKAILHFLIERFSRTDDKGSFFSPSSNVQCVVVVVVVVVMMICSFS